MVTVSQEHVVPAVFLLRTLRHRTSAPILVVGNVADEDARRFRALGAEYLDERDVDLSGRWPDPAWTEKHRSVGWYRQMFLRLSIDRYMTADHVVILDSEVFVFDNWDESRLYEDGRLKSFGWTPAVRYSDWDYSMYRGAAFILQGLQGCERAMEYAESDQFRRHISGVVLFSRANVAHLWRRLETETDLPAVMTRLFDDEPELALSDHDFYGIAADLGVFDEVDPPALADDLLGWYEGHTDVVFQRFRKHAMWSMNQQFRGANDVASYQAYIQHIASDLGRELPEIPYWNPDDRQLLMPEPTGSGTAYFGKYQEQLDHTFRARYSTMSTALALLAEAKPEQATIVEVGTLRDSTPGGGHSTFKFAEYLARNGGGTVHSVDILPEAIDFSREAVADYLPWVSHYVADSTQFLTSFSGEIDMLYLDGLDSTPGQETVASEKQLAEILAAYDRLSPNAVILLDDAALEKEGKTRLSSQFLSAHGFDLILDEYQRLYVRRDHGVAPSTLRARLGRLLTRTPRLKAFLKRIADRVQR